MKITQLQNQKPRSPDGSNGGIARLVVALQDPDQRVNGNGLAQIAKEGIIVCLGVEAAIASDALRYFFNKIHNEMIDFMKTIKSLQKSQSLLDKFVYLIIKMLDVLKFFFVKSYFYYQRTHINAFSLIRNIVSYRRGLKIYKNSKSNQRSIN